MLKHFTFTLLLTILVCQFPLEAKDAFRILGSHTQKKRVKGVIKETISWAGLPSFLDEHMGIPEKLKIEGRKIDKGTLTISFLVKKGEAIKKTLAIKDNQVDQKFNFLNFYYENISGKEGVLNLIIEDHKKKKIYSKIIPTRGDAG